MCYKPRNFIAQEFVPRAIYTALGDYSLSLMSIKILVTADAIRDYFGRSVYINNWSWGGTAQWRGLRLPESPYYSPTSQHTLANAIDCRIAGVSAEEARKAILSHRGRFAHISAIESGVPWLHVDCRNRIYTNGILLFKKRSTDANT